MSRHALNASCGDLFFVPDAPSLDAPVPPSRKRSIRISEAALPQDQNNKPHFECPECGFTNDRAPFCLFCLATNDLTLDVSSWEHQRARRVTSPCHLAAPLPHARRRTRSRRPTSAPLSLSTSTLFPRTATTFRYSAPAPAHTMTHRTRTMSMFIPQHTHTGTTTPALTPLSLSPFTASFSTTPRTFVSDTQIVAYGHVGAASDDDGFATDPGTGTRSGTAHRRRSEPPPLPLPPPPGPPPSSPPPLTPSKYSTYVSRQTAKRDARMLRIADLVTAAAVTLDAPASEPQPGSPTAPSMRSVQSSTANAPAPGSIALGHLLHIPGALKVSTRSKSGSISSHASLDLRSVRSRDRDEVESVYSHRDARSSRRGSVRASYRSGASSVAGNRSRTSFHRRGQSSQFSLAGPVLTQNREMTDEDADADAVDETTGPGPPQTPTLTTRKRVGNFFRKVGGVFSRRKVEVQEQPPTSSVPESARVPPPFAPSEVDVPLPVTREPHVPVKSLLKSLTIRRRTRRQPE